MVCLLCLKETNEAILICEQSKMTEVIVKYFWFDMEEINSVEKYICCDCWLKVNTFHEFYLMVERIHCNNSAPANNVVKSDIELIPEYDSSTHDKDDVEIDNIEEIYSFECKKEPDDKPDDEPDDEPFLNETEVKMKPKVQKDSIKYRTRKNSSKKKRSVCKSNTKAKIGRPKINRTVEAIVCFMCGKSVKNPGDLRQSLRNMRNHFLTHDPEGSKKFECYICQKKFSRAHRLREHLKDRHIQEPQYKEKYKAKVNCPICDKKLSFGSLREHISKIHNNIPRKGHEQVCDLCGKVCSDSSSLKYHLGTHKDKKLTQVQCDVCGKWMKNRVTLRVHKQMHKQSPNKCPHCDKVKLTVKSLRSHIFVAHSTPKHECHLCNKSFTRPKSLKEHLAIHTGESLYNCSYCTKTFKSNANMYKHMKEQHLEQWYRDRAKKKQK